MVNRLPLFGLVWFGLFDKRECKDFEDKEKTEDEAWDLFYFFSSLLASCTSVFRGVPLTFLQSNWLALCD